ncbi:trypsin-like peptidase domain-containing protein [Agathobacter sp. LCP21S3_B2]|uniref:S1C family serine protease n=1 Tax=Agathobacter sp. LCP21S3_B2 TaxID=3438734 RepID=UPI003F8EC8ED
MDNNYGNMNDTNNTNSTNNNTNNVNFTMSGNPYNPDESQKAAQTNNTSAETYSQSYNPYSQASEAAQPNVNQSYANQSYSNQSYNSGTNNNAYGGTSAGSTGSSYSRMNMNGQAYQQGSAYQSGQTQNTQYQNAQYQNAAKPKKQRTPRKPGAFGPFAAKTVAAALIFGLVGGGVFTGVSYVGTRAISNSSTASAKLSTTTSGGTKQTSSGDAKDLTDVSSVVDEVMPSIVAITNTGTVTYNSFFGKKSQQSQSCGSGIIVSEDDDYLYIATNNHVVADSEELTVQFDDDSVVKAEIRGMDPDDDLAVVRVKKADLGKDTYSNIKIATIGDSDSVVVGSPAIAIGNALGYGQSVTTGIVSALNRTVTTQDSQTGETVTNNKLIQTDAAINPGNSGGALLNENGEVIGINSVKYSSTEVEGIGYAIPMSVAKPIIESLIQDGKYTNENQAYLGIKGGDVSSEMVAYGFPQGVYVSSVSAGSGAANAGLQEGDIITAIDSTKISSMTELQSALKSYQAGDKVTLTVARQSGRQYEENKVEVTLSSAKDIQQ